MLRALRSKSQSFLFKIFLVLIVIGFAAWGVGDLTGNKIEPIFKANNYETSYEEIISDFNRSRTTNTGIIDAKVAVQNGLLNNVLIQNKVKLIVNQEAHDLGLVIPRNFLKKHISENKVFHDENNDTSVFSTKKFNTLLRNNNITENDYIEDLKLQLLNNKIFNHINDINFYSKSFSKKFFQWQNQKLDLNYMLTPYVSLKDINIDESLKNTYFRKNKDSFLLPKLRNISYISFKPELFYDQIIITKKEINDLYKERLDTFTRPETRDYLQVVFKTYDKAETFYKKVLTNQNFIKYAKELNFDEKDIRFKKISKINLTKKLSKIIFEPTDNILLKPFQSNFGYHVVQILKINKQMTKKLEEVSQSLTDELKYNLASEKLYEKIDLINDLAFSGNNLEEIIQLSKIKNLKINKISNLSKNGLTYINFKPSKINLDQKFLNEVWNLQTNEISELFEINENEFILLNVDNETKGRSLDYSDAKELIEEKIRLDTKIKETKLKSERDFVDPNLKKIFGLKRDQNENLESFFTSNILVKIFSSDTGKINSLETVSGILTYKILKKSTTNELNNSNIKEIDKNFKNELISDIQTIFYKSFETNQKIKTNLSSLNNLIKIN